MPAYETPGVYYERADARAPAIAALRTDIAGFVGIAERGPLDTPVPVESWRQFQAHFGDFTGGGYLAYAVRGFFENGGQPLLGRARRATAMTAGGAQAASTTLATSPASRRSASAASSRGHLGQRAVGRDRAVESGRVSPRHRPGR